MTPVEHTTHSGCENEKERKCNQSGFWLGFFLNLAYCFHGWTNETDFNIFFLLCQEPWNAPVLWIIYSERYRWDFEHVATTSDAMDFNRFFLLYSASHICCMCERLTRESYAISRGELTDLGWLINQFTIPARIVRSIPLWDILSICYRERER